MRFVIRAALVLAALLYSSDADACSCIGSGPPCQAFFQSDAVFVGTVRSIRAPAEPGPADRLLERRVVSFAIERPLRAVQGTTVDVRTGSGGGDCGFAFQTGERYVVYAYRHADGTLSTGICSRTRLASVNDLRDALRAIRRRPVYAFVSIATLMLGIGAVLAIFSLANVLLIRPLPGISNPDRLVRVMRVDREGAGASPMSYPLAALVPAYRASRVDPLVALKTE